MYQMVIFCVDNGTYLCHYKYVTNMCLLGDIMLDRIRDFFIWLELWLEDPANFSNADQIAIYMLAASSMFLLHLIVSLMYKVLF